MSGPEIALPGVGLNGVSVEVVGNGLSREHVPKLEASRVIAIREGMPLPISLPKPDTR